MVDFARVFRQSCFRFGVEVSEQFAHELSDIKRRFVVEPIDQTKQRFKDQCLLSDAIIVFDRRCSFSENERTQNSSFVFPQTGFDINVSFINLVVRFYHRSAVD